MTKPKFRSKYEETIWNAAKRSRKPLEYETLYLSYVLKGTYNPDFTLPNGIIVEAKGYLDAAARKKMIAVKAHNPDLDIRFSFQNANAKLNKRAKMRNWEWAEKHGFPWCQGPIPLEWWKEKKDV